MRIGLVFILTLALGCDRVEVDFEYAHNLGDKPETAISCMAESISGDSIDLSTITVGSYVEVFFEKEDELSANVFALNVEGCEFTYIFKLDGFYSFTESKWQWVSFKIIEKEDNYTFKVEIV